MRHSRAAGAIEPFLTIGLYLDKMVKLVRGSNDCYQISAHFVLEAWTIIEDLILVQDERWRRG